MKNYFRFITVLCLFCLWNTALSAQSKFTIKGSIIDKENNEALMGANVQVLSLPDSSLITGAMADDMGAFTLRDVKKAKYALKISFMGYSTRVMPLDLNERKSRQVDLGFLTLAPDSKMLQETVVTTTVAKVQVSGDSIVFNPAAYRVQQGATLEALVKLLPGAEVDDDGNITINGKSVNKILVDGKEFFFNDKSIAMKNIPVELIDKIKTYERKSDMARITGVDDGEEETVLDLSVKKGKKNGWFGNAVAGMGNEHRYLVRGIGNYFNDNTNVSVVANAFNVPENPRWNRGGLSSQKESGINFASNTPNMESGGSVSYRYNGSDYSSRNYTEYHTDTRFASNRYQSYSSNHNLDAQFKMEWRPDTMTTVLFRPNFNYSNNSSMAHSNSGDYDINVADMNFDEIAALTEHVLTTDIRQSQSHNNNTHASGDLQVTRLLSKPGRNVTLRLSGDYSQSESQQLSANSAFRGVNELRNRYNDTPARNYSASGQLVWSEPIADRLYLNVSYRYTYSYRKNDQQAFVYDEAAYQDFAQLLLHCRYDVDEVLRIMREDGYLLRDTVELCKYSRYRNYNQRISLQIRKVREKYNFSAGVDAFPEKSELDYRYMGYEYPEIARNVFNITPRINLRINFDKNTNLQMRYNGRTSQPSMTDLIDIVDDANPLNVVRGNENLKSSFTHNWNGSFNIYNPENQRGLWTWLYGNMSRNSISRKSIYNPNTRINTSIPKNINGNWNIGANVGTNIGLGKEKHFSIGGNIGGSYRQNVGLYYNYQRIDSAMVGGIKVAVIPDDAAWDAAETPDQKTITRSTRYNSGLNFNYRNDYVSIEMRGSVNGEHSTNNITKSANRDTRDYRYGSELKWTMPWGTELASDIYINSRRGYTQKDMNTDETIWNASISHSFLKGNALTIKGEVFDILGQQTNVSRSVSAEATIDSRNNGIYQYGLVSLIYRFSVFAGRNTMGTKDERSSDNFGGGYRRRGW